MNSYTLPELKKLCEDNNLGSCSGRGITRKVLYNKLVKAGVIGGSISPKKTSPRRKPSPKKRSPKEKEVKCKKGYIPNPAGTGKCIKIGGPTYEKLKKEGKILSKSRSRSPSRKSPVRSRSRSPSRKSPIKPRRDFENLPDDMLYEMAMKMEGEDLVNFCSTNKRFATLCNKRNIWDKKINKLKSSYMAPIFSSMFPTFSKKELYMFLVRYDDDLGFVFVSLNLKMIFYRTDFFGGGTEGVVDKLKKYYDDNQIYYVTAGFELSFAIQFDSKEKVNTRDLLKPRYVIPEQRDIRDRFGNVVYESYDGVLYTEKELKEEYREYIPNIAVDLYKDPIYGVTGPMMKDVDSATPTEVYNFIKENYM